MRTATKWAPLGTILAVLVLVLSAANAGGSSTLNPAQALMQADVQDQLMIWPDAAVAKTSSSVPESFAVDAAAKALWTTAAPALVTHGYARRTSSEPKSSVWIVVFAGGDPPPHEAADGLRTVVDFTGVIVDDTSGDVLRTFGSGHRE